MHDEGGWRSWGRLTRRMVPIVSIALRLLVMYFILLPVLDCSPAHRVDWRHDASVVGKNLDLLTEGYLNELNPMKVDGRRINCVKLIDTSKSKFDGFLYEYGAGWFRFLLARWCSS